MDQGALPLFGGGAARNAQAKQLQDLADPGLIGWLLRPSGKHVEMTEKNLRLNLGRRTFSLWGVRGLKNDERSALKGAGGSGESSADYNASMYALSCPILFSKELLHVIEGPDFRIYSPVQMRGGRSPSIQTEYVYIPCGSGTEGWARLIEYPSRYRFVYDIN